MTTTIEAIFERGVFRPVEPVRIAEGERVHLVVTTSHDPIDRPGAASILAEIAALPVESADEESTAREHDRFLYGAH